MSPDSETPSSGNVPEEGDSSQPISKKAAKKEAAKQEKERRRREIEAAAASLSVEEEGPLSKNYGNVPLSELQSVDNPGAGNWSEGVHGKNWTEVGALTESLKDQEVLIRGRVHTSRPVSGKLAFLVVRERGSTVQCVVTVKPDSVSKQMVKFVNALSKESIVDIIGVVSVPGVAIKGTTQQVFSQLLEINLFIIMKMQLNCEIFLFIGFFLGYNLLKVEVQVKKIYCVSRAASLPINIEDASRSEAEIEKALKVRSITVMVSVTKCNY